MPKNEQVSKIGVWSLLYSKYQYVPGHTVFVELLDNVELITYMKIENILMTGRKDMGKKLQNIKPNT